MDNQPIIVERVFDASPDRVWSAITDNEEMKHWYFQLPEFKAEPGFSFSFEAGAADKKYLHLCKVIEVEEKKKLSYSWHYDGFPGDSLVTIELFPEGNKTKLRLTHTGVETFPHEVDKNFGKESFTKGWTHIIGTSLSNYLAK